MDTSFLEYQADTIMRGLYRGNAPGAVLLVAKDGRMIIKKGYGFADLASKEPITPSTNFRMASISKQFTATCIMLLAAQQKIFLSDHVSKYFHSLPAAIRGITIHQLLTHTSGIVDYETLISPGQTGQVLDEDVLQLVKQKGSVYFPPGAKFKYSNTGYCLLALIVQQASGMPYAVFVKKNIFDPLQMNGSLVYEKGGDIQHRAYGYHPDGSKYHFTDQDITSATRGDGGVYTSVNDYLKWNEALEKNVLLSKEWTDSIFTSHALVEDNIGYGYGWFTGKEKDGTGCRFHSGESTGFRNMVYCNPEKHLLIAVFSNRDDHVVAKAFDAVAGLLDIQTVFPHENSRSLVQWLSRAYGD